ncbi:MAG: sugar ABC transporter permease [Gammaproteobacteria bacterium]
MSLLSSAFAAQTRQQTGAREPWLSRPLYLMPALLLLVVFFLAPAAATIVISFTDWDLGNRTPEFIGFANYHTLFTDADIRISLTNTLVLNAVIVPVSFAVALLLALGITSVKRGAAFWQIIYFLPVTSNLVAMAVVWDYLLHPELGFVAKACLALGIEPVNWLNDRRYALFTVGFISSWQQIGYYMVLFLAGLLNISPTLYEAARIDGARSALDRFRHVTWPMLGPTALFVFIITVIKSFQIFDVVKVLTKGGPDNATEIILHTMYQEGFVFFRIGLAASIATIFFLVMLALTLWQIRSVERHVHYR